MITTINQLLNKSECPNPFSKAVLTQKIGYSKGKFLKQPINFVY